MKGLAMDEDERAAFDAARDIPENHDDDFVTDDEIDINDVLDGRTQIDLSHAGGEFQDIIDEELQKTSSYVYPSLLNYLFTFLTGVVVLIHELVEIVLICGTKDFSDK